MWHPDVFHDHMIQGTNPCVYKAMVIICPNVKKWNFIVPLSVIVILFLTRESNKGKKPWE